MQTWEVAEEREDTLEEEEEEAAVVSVSASTTSQQGRNSIKVDIDNNSQANTNLSALSDFGSIVTLKVKHAVILQLNDVNSSSNHPGVLLKQLELHPLFTAATSLALLADVRPRLPHQQKIVALAQTRCVSARPSRRLAELGLNSGRNLNYCRVQRCNLENFHLGLGCLVPWHMKTEFTQPFCGVFYCNNT